MNYSFLTMVLFWIACGALSAYLAKQRNRNPIIWFSMGLLFSLFGLLCLLLLPSKKAPSQPVIVAKNASPPDIKHIHNEAAAFSDGPPFQPPQTLRISRDTTMDWYFIDHNSNVVGPTKLADLRKALLSQKLDNQTYIWCEEFPDWTQIKNLQNGAFLLDPDFL